MQLKGRSSGQKNVRLNSCESNSDDEIVERDNHVSDTPVDADEVVAFGLYKIGTEHLSTESVNSVNPYVVNVQLGKAKVSCKMKLDTGASKHVYDSVLSNFTLRQAGIILRAYSGETIPVLGKNSVPVKYDNFYVPKSDGSIRVCGDYKAINECIQDDVYKLPNVQDMSAMLSQDGANTDTFSVIDLASAFNQLFLDEESTELLTFNTRKGLFKSSTLEKVYSNPSDCVMV